MATETTPYIPHNPGDLITAEDWNDLQNKIKDDIAKQIQDAIENLDNVPNADNAARLENKTADELSEEILEKAREELPARTGYRMLFKRLKTDEEKVIEHGLKAAPLVDVYQLDYFEVVCSEDDHKDKMWVNFYLYHSGEKKLKHGGAPVEIESIDSHPYKIRFSDLLSLYQVKYTDNSSLADVENEFWKALFATPNDEFDDDQYCHSPWFDKCCCDMKIVEDLKKRGDWDDIWFQMRPRKTINYQWTAGSTPTPAPTQIQVAHFDFDNLGIKLVANPVLPPAIGGPGLSNDELKVMVLLKV
ncbi:MAG: hypothetical protein ACU83N_10945 [Gammaproteobacteria bacterium]